MQRRPGTGVRPGMPPSPGFLRPGASRGNCRFWRHGGWDREVAIYGPQPSPQLRHAVEPKRSEANNTKYFANGCLCRVEGNTQSIPNRYYQNVLPDGYFG